MICTETSAIHTHHLSLSFVLFHLLSLLYDIFLVCLPIFFPSCIYVHTYVHVCPYTYHLLCALLGFQLRADQVMFNKMLTQLQTQPVFQLRDFESTVEYMRNVVAQVCI